MAPKHNLPPEAFLMRKLKNYNPYTMFDARGLLLDQVTRMA